MLDASHDFARGQHVPLADSFPIPFLTLREIACNSLPTVLAKRDNAA
jgi:hypothetical protein